MDYIKSKIRDVVDFPSKGIVFKDLTTVFKDPRALHIIGWDLSQLYRDKGITKVVGIESRGFIGGSILAYEIGAGFVPARKSGKLPADTIRMEYAKSMARTLLKFIAMPSLPTILSSFTTTFLRPVAQWPLYTSSSKAFIRKKYTSTSSSSCRRSMAARLSLPMPK